mgnify:CR=1 FL=1
MCWKLMPAILHILWFMIFFDGLVLGSRFVIALTVFGFCHSESLSNQISPLVFSPCIGGGLRNGVGHFEHSADPAEGVLKCRNVDFPGGGIGVERLNSSETCRLPHAHGLPHGAAGSVGVMSGAETASHHPYGILPFGNEGAVGHIVGCPVGHIRPVRFFLSAFGFAMIFNWGTTEEDSIVESGGTEAIVAGQPVLPVNPPGFAN